jgi:hypothetical protein
MRFVLRTLLNVAVVAVIVAAYWYATEPADWSPSVPVVTLAG